MAFEYQSPVLECFEDVLLCLLHRRHLGGKLRLLLLGVVGLFPTIAFD